MGGEGGWLNNPHAIWEGREAGSIIHTPYGREGGWLNDSHAIWEGGRLAQ